MSRSRTVLFVCLAVPLAGACAFARTAAAVSDVTLLATTAIDEGDRRAKAGNAPKDRGAKNHDRKSKRSVPSPWRNTDATLREIQRIEGRARKSYTRVMRDLSKLERARWVLLRQVRQARDAVRKTARTSKRQDSILGRIAVMRKRTTAVYRSVLAEARTLEAAVHAKRTVKRRLSSLQRSVASFKKQAERERRALARTASSSARVLQAERSRLERLRHTVRVSRPPASVRRKSPVKRGLDPSRRIALARKMKRDKERLSRIQKELRDLERQISKLERDVKRIRKARPKTPRQKREKNRRAVRPAALPAPKPSGRAKAVRRS